MDYLEAPEYLDYYPSPSIFLGGGITGCPDWQTKLVDLLKDESNGILMNPRRKNFDIKNPNVTQEQITWEFKHLWEAECVVFWFCKETIQPIVLLELGARLAHHYLAKDSRELTVPKILIGIEKGYPREQDVIVQTELAFGATPVISDSLEHLAGRIKKECFSDITF